jgi:hypothetical protein
MVRRLIIVVLMAWCFALQPKSTHAAIGPCNSCPETMQTDSGLDTTPIDGLWM